MYVEEVYCHQLYQYLLFFILFLLPLFHFSSSSFFLSFKFSFSIDPTFLNFYSSHYLFLFLSFSQNLLCIVLPLFFFFIFFFGAFYLLSLRIHSTLFLYFPFLFFSYFPFAFSFYSLLLFHTNIHSFSNGWTNCPTRHITFTILLREAIFVFIRLLFLPRHKCRLQNAVCLTLFPKMIPPILWSPGRIIIVLSAVGHLAEFLFD